MIPSICPMGPERLHEILIRPFCEGMCRINQVWHGYNLYSLNKEPLHWIDRDAKGQKTLGQRSIALIAGICLTIPFIHVVIWIAWVTFGHPEVLGDVFYLPEEAELPSQQPVNSSASEPAKGSL